MSKHTEGPWEAKEWPNGQITIDAILEEKVRLAEVNTAADETDEQIEETEANAQLMSASPDMLGALQALLADFKETGNITNDSVVLAETSIHKATGEYN